MRTFDNARISDAAVFSRANTGGDFTYCTTSVIEGAKKIDSAYGLSFSFSLPPCRWF
jgi:hypothetical protein